MYQFDIRTVYLSYIIINMINLVLIGSLYIQIKKRFPGTFLILISFLISSLGNILVFLRGSIPDWISISLSNTMIVSSTVLLLIALEKFVNRKGPQIQNYLLIVVFLLVHSYFAFVKPDLNARIINFSLAYVVLSFQIAWLMLKRTHFTMRKITRPVGLVFSAVFIVQVFRIVYVLQNQHSPSDYFSSESSESVFLLLWETIIILLVYSITLMYNKRLIIDVNVQEEKFSKAFHAAPFIIMLSKVIDGKIFEVNQSVQSISGYHPNELIGLTSVDLNIWKRNDDRLKFISNMELNGLIRDQEYEFRKKSGELFIGLISAEFININNERCIISVISDITNRKHAEYNLRKSETSLRELNSTKDKFFSIIAHDLKSPFNGIMGFSELLMEGIRKKDFERIDKYAEIINTSSKHAMNLLSNLMEWSRSQTGRMEFNPEYIDAVILIQSVIDLIKTSAEQKLIRIVQQLPSSLILYADKAMLEAVLRNLISNAVKFTPKNGKVTIVLEENETDFLLSVKDNGIGIEKHILKKLFRIDSSYSTVGTENEKGTGLGLILCKDFIDKHKGKIWVESEPGFGSIFYFSLPKNKNFVQPNTTTS